MPKEGKEDLIRRCVERNLRVCVKRNPASGKDELDPGLVVERAVTLFGPKAEKVARKMIVLATQQGQGGGGARSKRAKP